jgi:hypothetical protein
MSFKVDDEDKEASRSSGAAEGEEKLDSCQQHPLAPKQRVMDLSLSSHSFGMLKSIQGARLGKAVQQHPVQQQQREGRWPARGMRSPTPAATCLLPL